MGQDASSPIDESVPPQTLEGRTIEAVAKYVKEGRAKNIVVMVSLLSFAFRPNLSYISFSIAISAQHLYLHFFASAVQALAPPPASRTFVRLIQVFTPILRNSICHMRKQYLIFLTFALTHYLFTPWRTNCIQPNISPP